MNCEIQNLSRRLVSIYCNSGKTCHLPPGYTHELPEAEVNGNAFVKKLQDRKLIVVRTSATKPTATASSSEPSGELSIEEQEEKTGGSGKTSKKKSQASK